MARKLIFYLGSASAAGIFAYLVVLLVPNIQAGNWNAVGALAALFYAATFLFSFSFFYSQLREMRLSRDTEMLTNLYDRLIRSRRQRILIYDNEDLLKAINTLEKWDVLRRANKALGAAVNDVSMDYHLVGLIVTNGLLRERKAFMHDIGEVFLRIHGIIGPIVKIERKRSGNTYRAYLENLAREVSTVLGAQRVQG